MSTKRIFGELETSILKAFKKKERLTVRDVLTELGGADKYTTIMTVMNRLADKKHLLRERIGPQYEYWLNESNIARTPSLLDKIKQKIFGGSSAQMASYLIESGDISDGELEKIEKLVKEMRRSEKR